jgi:hypothetical protein
LTNRFSFTTDGIWTVNDSERQYSSFGTTIEARSVMTNTSARRSLTTDRGS